MKISRRRFSALVATAAATPALYPILAQERAVITNEADETSNSADEKTEDGVAPLVLDADEEKRRKLVHSVLDYYYAKNQSTATRSPWGVMHALIPFGVDAQIIAGGRKVNAIGWLLWNQPCRGIRIFQSRGEGFYVKKGPGVQGHDGQLLAILAQSRVHPEYAIKVGGREYTLEDLIEYEKETCVARTELTFKLIGLSHYLDTDASWKCQRGQTWDIPRLIREELKQKVIGAACGGTHRLMGFSYAVWRRKNQEQPIEGQFARAEKYIQDYHAYTFKLQNRDGSFSTNWFAGRGANPSVARRIQTSGHILEWLVFSLPDEELSSDRIKKAVDFLAGTLLKHRDYDWEVGPLGHALHALSIYDRRVYGTKPGHRNLRLAKESEAEKSDSN